MPATQLSPTTGMTLHGRRVVTLSTGRRVAFVNVAGGVAVQVSDDFGETWYTCTTPASGIIDVRTDSVLAADPDANDAVHVIMGCTTSASQRTLDYYVVTLAGLVASVVKTQVRAAGGVNIAYANVELIVHSGASGASKNVLIAYNLANVDAAPGAQTLYARSAVVTTGGVPTFGTEYSIATNSEGGTRYVFAISKNASGVCKLLYQQYTTIKVAAATLTAPLTAAPALTSFGTTCNFMNGLTAIDGLSACMWMGHGNSELWFWHETDHAGSYGEWLQVSNTTYGTKPTLTVVANTVANKLLVAAPRSTAPNYLCLLEMDVPTKAGTDRGTWGVQTATFSLATVRKYDGQSIPVLYNAAGGVYMEVNGSPFVVGYHMII